MSRPAFIAAITLAFTVVAHAEPTVPVTITCEDVKAKVSELGKRDAIRFARSHGATWRQIVEAAKCLGR